MNFGLDQSTHTLRPAAGSLVSFPWPPLHSRALRSLCMTLTLQSSPYLSPIIACCPPMYVRTRRPRPYLFCSSSSSSSVRTYTHTHRHTDIHVCNVSGVIARCPSAPLCSYIRDTTKHRQRSARPIGCFWPPPVNSHPEGIRKETWLGEQPIHDCKNPPPSLLAKTLLVN